MSTKETKLPPSLEKIRDSEATIYGANSRHLKTSQHFIDGFDKGAELERKRAQVLIDAIKREIGFIFLVFGLDKGPKYLEAALRTYEKETAE